jgi:hypothetical protein
VHATCPVCLILDLFKQNLHKSLKPVLYTVTVINSGTTEESF